MAWVVFILSKVGVRSACLKSKVLRRSTQRTTAVSILGLKGISKTPYKVRRSYLVVQVSSSHRTPE